MTTDQRRSGSRALGRRVASLRGVQTQPEIVARMNGMSAEHVYTRQWLSTVENGRRGLRNEHAVLLARALGVSMDELFDTTHEPSQDRRLDRLAAMYRDRIDDDDLGLVEALLDRLARPPATR